MNEELQLTPDANPVHPHEYYAVLAVICLAVVPDLVNAIFLWSDPEAIDTSLTYIQTSLIVRAVQVSAPVLIIVALSRIEWSSIGFVPVRWLPDILLGLCIWIASTLAFYAVTMLLPPSALHSPESALQYERPTDWPGYVLLVAGSCANGFAEELVIRGYLLTRFERLLQSTPAALFISTMLFASYHIYQGVGSAIGIAALGFVYGAAFCFLRRLWPLVVAHAIADVAGWMATYA